MIILERLFEAGAPTQSQNLLRQEVTGVFGTDPAQAICGKAPTWHDAVDVRMEAQVASPGLEDGEQAQFSAEVFMIPGDILQRGGALSNEQGVKDFLMGTDEGAQLSGHGEGHQEVRHGQQALALAGQPDGGIGVAALWAGAVIAGVIDKVLASTLAPEELSSERGGAATENGGNGAPVRRPEARAKLPFIRRPVAAQNVGQ